MATCVELRIYVFVKLQFDRIDLLLQGRAYVYDHVVNFLGEITIVYGHMAKKHLKTKNS